MVPPLAELLGQHVWGLLVGGGVVAARICISDKIPGDANMLVHILRILKMCWDHTLRITILKSHALCLVLLKWSKQVGREQGCC